MHLVIFEGNQWRTFAPFSLSRPVFMLQCGMGTLLDKQIRATSPTRVTLWVRPALEAYCREHILPNLPCPGSVNTALDDEPALVMSGRTLHFSRLEVEQTPSVVVDVTADGRRLIRQAVVHSPGLTYDDVQHRTDRWMKLLDLPDAMPQSRMPTYVWDLINWNEEAIVADSIESPDESQPLPTGPFHFIEEENIWLGEGVKLLPGCVLDGSRGPIHLADNVTIGPNAVIQGPCYIGPHTQISPLALIRGGTSIGPMCKIGGEVSSSIIMGYSNKAHDGFLGDSYVGEWVNLGAGTTTSNLKNTYSEIKMRVDGTEVKTGRRFLGSLIGDHTKAAIGTRFMTGSYIGYSCMVATSAHAPKFIPSFTFLTDEGPVLYRQDKAEETMQSAFSRRGRNWSPTDGEMNRYVLENAVEVEKQAPGTL